MTADNNSTEDNPDPTPFKVYSMTNEARSNRMRGGPTREFASKEQAIKFAGRQVGGSALAIRDTFDLTPNALCALRSSAPGAWELVVTSVSGTMYRAVAAERETMAGLLPSCFAPFRRCLIFSPRFHARPGNVTGHIEEMLLCAAKLGGGAGSDSVLEIS